MCTFEVLTAATLSGLAGALDVFPFTDIPVIYGIEILMIISIAINFGIKIDENFAILLIPFLTNSLSISIIAFFKISALLP